MNMEWISVEDQLPPNKEMVLIWYAKAGVDENSHYKAGVYIGYYLEVLDEFRPIGCNGNFIHDISHWMPCPGSPHNPAVESDVRGV